MNKSLTSMLPSKEPKVPIQVKVPQSLKMKVEEILKSNKWSWTDLIVTAMRKLIEESKNE